MKKIFIICIMPFILSGCLYAAGPGYEVMTAGASLINRSPYSNMPYCDLHNEYHIHQRPNRRPYYKPYYRPYGEQVTITNNNDFLKKPMPNKAYEYRTNPLLNKRH